LFLFCNSELPKKQSNQTLDLLLLFFGGFVLMPLVQKASTPNLLLAVHFPNQQTQGRKWNLTVQYFLDVLF